MSNLLTISRLVDSQAELFRPLFCLLRVSRAGTACHGVEPLVVYLSRDVTGSKAARRAFEALISIGVKDRSTAEYVGLLCFLYRRMLVGEFSSITIPVTFPGCYTSAHPDD
jgi:hypothetical protein